MSQSALPTDLPTGAVCGTNEDAPFEGRDRWRTWYTPSWHEDGSRPYRTLAEARTIQERRRAWHEQWRARLGQEYQWIRIFDGRGRIVEAIHP